MKELKGAIFDLDGTLLESMGIWAQIDRWFLAKRGISLPDDYVEKVTPMNYRDAAAYTIARFSLTETAEEVIRDWVEMSEQAYRFEIALKPRAGEFLRKLKSRGVKLAVATAQTPELYEPALKNNGVFDLFDAFAHLGEVERGKGFPDIYFLAAQRLGLSAQDCVVFEDISAGIRGAKAGGFWTCGVYDVYSDYEKEIILREADEYINSFAELLEPD
ncbi:HAD family hydrolase [Caproiciproducens faecalis]|uniref:HAD family phosphatase n=1 Tax=Caproiciproducens faecalis TaxID=2820301 RepID=A0ABS7DLH7_9FIRM|nr:HAD family phosphatase [Caproiciproducens faecalis]MBW7572133.1 HAD family phosphatase [Caproiciproducens faecalis]